jgi:hypothetical protein
VLYIRERAEAGLKYMDAISQLLPLRLRNFRLRTDQETLSNLIDEDQNGTPCQVTGVPFFIGLLSNQCKNCLKSSFDH